MRRRTRAVVGLGIVTAAAVGLVVALADGGQSSHGQASGEFAWLRPAPPPADWTVAHTSGGAALSYPPGWRPIKSDPGSASVALLRGGDQIAAYLNATPKQGPETLANWNRFRPDHNRDEGDRSVRVIAASDDLMFRSGTGSCVQDVYTTSRTTFREIACLVSGATSSAVVVAAAPSALWDREAPTLQRAVSSFVP
jgi:hypothetical protein